MRIAMFYAWQGIAKGSKGLIKSARTNPDGAGTLLTCKFDYGETREVPKAATLPEIIYKKQFE